MHIKLVIKHEPYRSKGQYAVTLDWENKSADLQMQGMSGTVIARGETLEEAQAYASHYKMLMFQSPVEVEEEEE